MIYIKIKSDVYNENNIEGLKQKYSISLYKESKALIRVTKHILGNELKTYPDIDIVISYKSQRRILGRLCLNRYREYREYKFIKQKTGNPYILLFWYAIESYYNWHCIKGLKKVLLHEYGHFKDWLLNNKIGHNKCLPAIAGDDVNKELTQVLNYIRK